MGKDRYTVKRTACRSRVLTYRLKKQLFLRYHETLFFALNLISNYQKNKTKGL